MLSPKGTSCGARSSRNCAQNPKFRGYRRSVPAPCQAPTAARSCRRRTARSGRSVRPARRAAKCRTTRESRWRGSAPRQSGKNSLQQAGRVSGLFDTVVVLFLGRHELRGALQGEYFLVLRIGRVELEEGVSQLLDQRRVEVATHRPVVVKIRRRGREDADLVGIDLLLFDQLVPDRGVEHAGFRLAGRDEGDGGVMGAGVGDVPEILFRIQAGLLQEEPWHQAARGGRRRAEGEGLALEIGNALDVGV